MTLTVGIDARAAAEVPAGRGRYVRELLAALERLEEARDVRFVLYARERWGALDPERFAWRLVGLPDPAWHLAAAARASREVDVLLSTNSYLTAWFCRKPTAVVVYDLVPFVDRQNAKTSSARIEQATIRPALRRAAALPCISEATRADLARLFPYAESKATMIPLAADPAFSAPVAAPGHPALKGQPYVLAVGTLEPRKNLERLIAAWSAMDERARAGHVLALVGPIGWDAAPIVAAARDHGAQLLGRVSEDELRALYAGASAFAYPSLYEGFGLPILEAMAAGAPVLTSNVSSLPEVAGDAALLVDPTDVDAIGTALTRLLAHPALAEDLRARGRARAALFSWERTARETLALLRSIAASR
jgi:glycosyltransferase involved in cell wall biosynthesis